MSERLRGTAEMTVAMVISGTIGWFVVMSGRPVLDVVFWRCVFGAVTLLAVCTGMGLLRGRLPLRILGLAALGGVAIVLNWLLLFAAYSRASIGIATVVYNTQPFMLVGLGALFLRERVTAGQLAWLGLAFAGMMLIVEGKPAAAVGGSDYLGGILLALAAAFFYALAAIVARRLAGTPPHLIALVQVCVGILMLAPFADLARPPSGAAQWTLLATVGVVHTGLMYILLYGALQRLPTHLVGALSFIYPIAAVLVDLLAFGHPLQGLQIAGAAAVLLAAAAMNLGWSVTGRPPRRVAPAQACD